jgi:hypothetical protein
MQSQKLKVESYKNKFKEISFDLFFFILLFNFLLLSFHLFIYFSYATFKRLCVNGMSAVE